MYNKHEHFRQVKHVYQLTLSCIEYVVSKTALVYIYNSFYIVSRTGCICINNLFLGHVISICAKFPINKNEFLVLISLL